MEWGDVALLCFLGLALWTFIPRPARAGLGDLVHGAADAVRSLVRSIAPALSWLAYEVLLGVKRERVVNDYADDMSRAADEALRPSEPSGLSVQGRTGDQELPPPPAPAYTRAQLLTLYTLLRAHGVSRERARPVLKEAGIPLSNDVWAAAAPASPPAAEEEPEYLTPIAGRPTKARYHDDEPELIYREPA